MNETVLIAAIVIYGLFIIFGTKWVFEFMMARNMKENVAIYYAALSCTRKKNQQGSRRIRE